MIHAEDDFIQLVILLQHPQQCVPGCAAERYIAVLLPVLWVEGNEGQQIDGRLEYVETPIGSNMMKAVLGITTLHIQSESFSLTVGTSLVCVSSNTVCIRADKHCVVVLRIFVEQFCSGECRYDITVNPSTLNQISIDSPHI